jgi:hypothetical protein
MGVRLLAHVSGDEGLIADVLRGSDVHASTARRVYGLKEVSGQHTVSFVLTQCCRPTGAHLSLNLQLLQTHLCFAQMW